MTNQDFEITQVKILQAELKAENRDFSDFDEQLKTNKAFVYFMKSGKVILLPNSLTDTAQAIKLRTKEGFLHYLQQDSFPIENINLTLEDLFHEELRGLTKSVNDAFTYFDCEPSLLTKDKLETIRNSKVNYIKSKAFIYSRLLLGEFVKNQMNGKWLLPKQYGSYNPYYSPAILPSDGGVLPLFKIGDIFYKDDISVDGFLKTPEIVKLFIRFHSAHFNELFPSYIEL